MQVNLIKRFFAPEYLVKKEHRLGELPGAKEAYRDVFRIAFPSVVEMVLMSLISSIDTMMVGNFLGAEALSAIGLTSQPRLVLLCVFMALNTGITAIVARRKGEGRQDAANATMRNALMLAVALSLVIMSLALVFARPFLMLAGGNTTSDEKVFNDAVDYFRIMAYSLPLSAISMSICAAQRGIGKTKLTMYVNMTNNLVNVFFNYCLIAGKFGFPRLEVKGAAIASVIGLAVGCVLAVATVVMGGKHKGYLHLSIRDKWNIDKSAMRSIVTVGSNAMLEQLGLRAGFFIYGRLLFSLGTTMYAAHSICLQILSITYTLGDGLAVAATALVGQNLGRKRADVSMLYGKICQRYAVVSALVLGSMVAIFRHQIVGLFLGENTANAEVVLQYAAQTMLVVACIQPFQTSTVSLAGALRGAGDNIYVAIIATSCVLVLRTILTALAVYVFVPMWPDRLDLPLTWIFGLFELIARFFFFYPRFASGKWKDKKV